jgi:hypothetical protein
VVSAGGEIELGLDAMKKGDLPEAVASDAAVALLKRGPLKRR